MTLSELFDKIFQHPDLINQPPVLLDIGASGSLHSNWHEFARFSICVAFDPDDREMEFINEKAKNFKRLYVINKIVTDRDIDNAEFHLTRSPFCSSLLQPNNESLADWAFADLFEVERKIELPATTLEKALDSININYIDWYKSDSQGLDLSIFKTTAEKQYTTIVADFEPGFIDAYNGENKIKDLLPYMENMPFWLHSFNPGNNQRMNVSYLGSAFKKDEIDNIRNNTADSAIYAEITYINNFKTEALHTERYYLLGCVFSLTLKQYAFAAELALRGQERTGNELFGIILNYIKEATVSPGISKLATNPKLLKMKAINFMIRQLKKLL
jgi:hypothetical protein